MYDYEYEWCIYFSEGSNEEENKTQTQIQTKIPAYYQQQGIHIQWR